MKDLSLKISFILGIIFVLIIIAVGIMQFVPKMVSSMASVRNALFSGSSAHGSIGISPSSQELENSVPVMLAWNHADKKEEGKYSVSYACGKDVIFDIVGTEKSQRLICNQPLNLGDKVGTIKLRPIIETDEYGTVPITIAFENIDGEETFSTINMLFNAEGQLASNQFVFNLNDNENVSDLSVSEPTSTSTSSTGNTDVSSQTAKPTSYQTGAQKTEYVSGPADLRFSNAYADANNTVNFTVINTGGQYSGAWTLSYTTPTSPIQTEYSGTQISLAPGQALQFALRFNDRYVTRNSVTINIDPSNYVSESNESNNQTVVILPKITGNYDIYNDRTYRSSSSSRDEADLVIEDLEVGYVTSSGRFVEDDEIDEDDDAAIRITVENRGDRDAGRFDIEITYPSRYGGTKQITKRASALDEGDEDTYVIELHDIRKNRTNTIEVEVDSDDDVDEENERNNDDDIRLEIR